MIEAYNVGEGQHELQDVNRKGGWMAKRFLSWTICQELARLMELKLKA